MPPDRRRFTLADLMVLIAMIAVAFPLGEWIVGEQTDIGRGYTSIGPGNWVNFVWMRQPSAFAVALTLGLIPLRWLGRRPPASRVLRQPGAVACLAVAGAMIAGVTLDIGDRQIRMALSPPTIRRELLANSWYWYHALNPVPLAVLGAWSALAICGRWSPEASWIDRLGRVLGVFWIADFAVGFFWAPLTYWLPYKG